MHRLSVCSVVINSKDFDSAHAYAIFTGGMVAHDEIEGYMCAAYISLPKAAELGIYKRCEKIMNFMNM